MYAYIDDHFNGRRSYILRCDPALILVNSGDYVDLNSVTEGDLREFIAGVDQDGIDRLSEYLDDKFENLESLTVIEYTNLLFDIITEDALMQNDEGGM